MHPLFRYLLSAAALGFIEAAHCDIDRVYHPYVTPLEVELEWRGIVVDDNGDPDHRRQLHSFAIGRTFGERLLTEAYVVGEKLPGDSFDLAGFELEAVYQLTEAGEYWADWGVIAEFERDIAGNVWEAGGGLLVEKEFGVTSATANLLAKYEWGGGIDNELELEGALQWRWRWRETFEPALEYYVGDGTQGIGPVAAGMLRFDKAKLKWETGVIFGVSNDTPERTWRALLEYEF